MFTGDDTIVSDFGNDTLNGNLAYGAGGNDLLIGNLGDLLFPYRRRP